MSGTSNIAVVGSRDFGDYDLLRSILDDYIDANSSQYGELSIISGGARGADTLAERYAAEHSMQLVVHKAEWKKYGKAAGMIRNKYIIEQADVVFAFWDGKSKGTKNSIDLAKKMKKEVHVLGFNS